MPDARPPTYDIAILGGELAGTLIALALKRFRPATKFILIGSDPHFGGARLEACVADEIPDYMAPLLEGAIVKSWPRCYVAYPDFSQSFEDPMMLVDPRHLHIELVEQCDRTNLMPSCSIASVEGDIVSHTHGTITASLIIDADDRLLYQCLGVRRETSNRDFNLQHDLEFPIIADIAAPTGDWDVLQIFPIDDERVAVERLQHRRRETDWPAQPAFARTGDHMLPIWDAQWDRSGHAAREADHRLFPSPLQLAARIAATFADFQNDDITGLKARLTEQTVQAAHDSAKFAAFVHSAQSAATRPARDLTGELALPSV